MHKFYLAFENCQCNDYVTEKYYRAIEEGAVPIIIGWENNTDFEVAPHSTIQLSDFKSIKDLADYIKLLDSNDRLYEEYLWYKNKEGQPPRKPEDVLNPKFLEMYNSRRGMCGIAERVIEIKAEYVQTGKEAHASYESFCPNKAAWKAHTKLE